MKIHVSVMGASGRVGKLLLEQIACSKEFVLASAIVSKHSSCIGTSFNIENSSQKIYFEPFTDSALQNTAVVIDFSSKEGLQELLPVAIKNKCALVTGTTGLDEQLQKEVKKASLRIPILQASNTALGMNVLLPIITTLSQSLSDFDTEIFELHHKHKKDAPSGTALTLAATIAEARNLPLALSLRHGRNGFSNRSPEEIGIHSARGGDCVGEHTVYFLGDGERIEITYRASQRSIYAKGALLAARWLVGKPARLYSMHDIIKR